MVARSRPNRLARTRSKPHGGFVLILRSGGGLVSLSVVMAGVVVASEVKKGAEPELWKAALITVVVLAVIGVLAVLVGGAGSFLTRPVTERHATDLRNSAELLEQRLSFGLTTLYGEDGYQRKAVFQVHYPRLGDALDGWDGLLTSAGESRGALHDHVAAELKRHGIVDPGFGEQAIRDYLVSRLENDAKQGASVAPLFEGWGSAGTPPPAAWGERWPIGQPKARWIWLPMEPDETPGQWELRSKPYQDRVQKFVTETYETALPLAMAAAEAARRVDLFKASEMPSLLDDVRLIQQRERPRALLRGCSAC
jgi:hypothetical protein